LISFGTEGGGALRTFVDGERYLKNGNYVKFGGQVDFFAEYISCIETDSPTDPPLPDKSVLSKYVAVFYDLVEIMNVISIYLLD
jgi:hypothetical protein